MLTQQETLNKVDYSDKNQNNIAENIHKNIENKTLDKEIFSQLFENMYNELDEISKQTVNKLLNDKIFTKWLDDKDILALLQLANDEDITSIQDEYNLIKELILDYKLNIDSTINNYLTLISRNKYDNQKKMQEQLKDTQEQLKDERKIISRAFNQIASYLPTLESSNPDLYNQYLSYQKQLEPIIAQNYPWKNKQKAINVAAFKLLVENNPEIVKQFPITDEIKQWFEVIDKYISPSIKSKEFISKYSDINVDIASTTQSEIQNFVDNNNISLNYELQDNLSNLKSEEKQKLYKQTIDIATKEWFIEATQAQQYEKLLQNKEDFSKNEAVFQNLLSQIIENKRQVFEKSIKQNAMSSYLDKVYSLISDIDPDWKISFDKNFLEIKPNGDINIKLRYNNAPLDLKIQDWQILLTDYASEIDWTIKKWIEKINHIGDFVRFEDLLNIPKQLSIQDVLKTNEELQNFSNQIIIQNITKNYNPTNEKLLQTEIKWNIEKQDKIYHWLKIAVPPVPVDSWNYEIDKTTEINQYRYSKLLENTTNKMWPKIVDRLLNNVLGNIIKSMDEGSSYQFLNELWIVQKIWANEEIINPSKLNKIIETINDISNKENKEEILNQKIPLENYKWKVKGDEITVEYYSKDEQLEKLLEKL